VDLTWTVSVVRAAYMILQNMLTMCCHATGTGWGAEGSLSRIVDGLGQSEHWHMTPDNFAKIFEWVLELNGLCNASTFLNLWAAACRRASDLMQNSYSVGHSLVHVVQVEFNPRLICGGAPARLPGDKPVADGPTDSKESKELSRLQRELKVARHELDTLRSGPT